MQTGFDWIGLGIVLLIFAAIIATLGTILAVRPRRAALDRVPQNTAGRKSILVSFTDPMAAAHAVELACRFASDMPAQVMLAYVIEVPLSLALTDPTPELEEQARGALSAATGTARHESLVCESRIVRDRTIAGGLIRLAHEAQVDVMVIGVRASLQSGLSDLVTVSDLFRRAPCELVVAKEPTLIKETIFQTGRVIETSIHT